jgi:hypothetical protein
MRRNSPNVLSAAAESAGTLLVPPAVTIAAAKFCQLKSLEVRIRVSWRDEEPMIRGGVGSDFASLFAII